MVGPKSGFRTPVESTGLQKPENLSENAPRSDSARRFLLAAVEKSGLPLFQFVLDVVRSRFSNNPEKPMGFIAYASSEEKMISFAR